MLATPTSRLRWAGSHVVVALAGTAWLLLLAGAGAGAVRGTQTGDVAQVGRLVVAAAAQLPAAAVLVAVVVLLFGVSVQVAAGGWAVLVACILLGELGPLVPLPQWVMDLSPFAHAPRLPGGQVDLVPLLVLGTTTVLLVGGGLVALQRRDVG